MPVKQYKSHRKKGDYPGRTHLNSRENMESFVGYFVREANVRFLGAQCAYVRRIPVMDQPVATLGSVSASVSAPVVVPTALIAEHFASLPDPQINRTRRHLLADVLVIALCAVIAG